MRLTRTVAVAVTLAALLAAGCRGSPSRVHAASSLGDHVYWSSVPSNGGVHARVRLYGVSLSRAGGVMQVAPL